MVVSLRTKLVLSTAAVFALVTLLVLLAAQRLLGDALRAATIRDAQRSASLLSIATAPLVAGRDFGAAQELCAALAADGRVPFVELRDTGGKVLARAGTAPEGEGPWHPIDAEPEELKDDVIVHRFAAPLRLGARVYGEMRFGLDNRGEIEAEAEVRWQLLLLCLGGLGAAALLQVLITGVLTRRLGLLRRAVERMAAGEQGSQVAVEGRDEVTGLAAAFNDMSLRLAQRIGELQSAESRQRELVDALRAAEQRLTEANEALERRVAERTAQLEAARDRAEQASRAKSEFLSRMSHELRTPLNAILGFTQVLRVRLKPAPAGVDEQLGHVENAGWHLLELINDVLDLSRIETGSMTISADVVMLAPLLEDCVRLTAQAAAANEVQVHVEVDAGVTAVRADATRLRQVFVNLLSNGCKYNRRGGEVRVRAGEAGGNVEVQVIDTGIGMSEAQLGAMFQPFNRLGAEVTGIEGSGIGLVITRRLLELMGGRLEVRSRAGAGSTFTVRLQAAQPVPAPSQALRVTPVDGPGSAARRRVLYVEDNPSNVALMTEVLALRPALRLSTAADAAIGLELARREHPDIVVVDIALPGMDGHTLCRHLRVLPGLERAPIVALSANAMAHDLQRGRESGFDRYFTKPLDVADFLRWIDATLEATA